MSMTLEEFEDKVDWEGGILEALVYGLTPEDAPEGEFRQLWSDLYWTYRNTLEPCVDAIQAYWDDHLEA